MVEERALKVRRLNDELVVPAGATSVATVAMQGGAVLPEQERLKREEHLAAVPAAISIIQAGHAWLSARADSIQPRQRYIGG